MALTWVREDTPRWDKGKQERPGRNRRGCEMLHSSLWFAAGRLTSRSQEPVHANASRQSRSRGR